MALAIRATNDSVGFLGAALTEDADVATAVCEGVEAARGGLSWMLGVAECRLVGEPQPLSMLSGVGGSEMSVLPLRKSSDDAVL